MIRHDPEFWDKTIKKERSFTKRINNCGPKDQAKKYIVGSKLPKSFLYATQVAGYYYYTIDSLPHFIYRYSNLPPSERHVYELIPGGYPVKMYIDAEYQRIPGNRETNMKYALSKLHECIGKVLQKECDRKLPDVSEVIYLDATTAKKASVHLIYPTVIFENMKHLSVFIKKVMRYIRDQNYMEYFRVEEETENGEVKFGSLIDEVPYHDDQIFRLYGSSKVGKKNMLLPLGGSASDPIDKMLLFKSLISVPCTMSGFNTGDIISLRLRLERFHSDLTISSSQSSKVVTNVLRHLRSKHPRQSNITWTIQGNRISFLLVPGVYCKVGHRFHKSNNTYFVISMTTGKGRYQCTDGECCNQPSRGKFNESTTAYQEWLK